MGNRVRFVGSCLVLAMLTGRALSVSFQDGYYAELRDLFESPGFEWEAGRLGGAAPRGGSSLDPKAFETLLCGDLSAKGPLGSAVTVAGNFYFLPYVIKNPRYSETARRWFNNEDDVFHMLTRTVFRPNEQVRGMLKGYMESQGEGWSCDLGFQIRNDNDPVSRPQISAKEWDLYRRCAKEALPRDKRDAPRVFVATDSVESRKICKKEIPYDFRYFGDAFQRSNNPDGVRTALVDLLAFSTCDVMLVSPWSSYGRVASAFAGRQAFFVTDWKMPIGEPHRNYLDVVKDGKAGCFRFLNTEPCPWHGPRGELGFNDIIRQATCWDAGMMSNTC